MNMIKNIRASALVLMTLPLANAHAQTTAPLHNTHPAPAAGAESAMQMQQELTKLREQVRVLEQRPQAATGAAMAASSAVPAAAPAMSGMKEMGMAGGRGMPMQAAGAMPMPMPAAAQPMTPPMPSGAMAMGDNMPMPTAAAEMPMPASAMPAAGGGMMQMMQSMMGAGGMMSSMGGMNSAVAMATPSTEPGLPGQSHLYHIGATGFFLDHPEHITLTMQQQQMLALHKEQALLKRTEQQVQIDAAEQQLWQLTGADQPQITAIETKTREIERLRGDQRVEFVRAVRDSAQILTNEQRMQLAGLAPAQPMPAMAVPMPAPMPAPMPMEDGM